MMSDRELERAGAGPQAQRVRSEAWEAQLEQFTDTRSSGLERPDVVVGQHQEIGRDGPDAMARTRWRTASASFPLSERRSASVSLDLA